MDGDNQGRYLKDRFMLWRTKQLCGSQALTKPGPYLLGGGSRTRGFATPKASPDSIPSSPTEASASATTSCRGRSWGWGKHPTVDPIMVSISPGAYSRAMRSRKLKGTLKLADLITAVYSSCDKRRAEAILRRAFTAPEVVFRGRRYVLGGGKQEA